MPQAMKKNVCPRCGNNHMQVVVTQLADVRFNDDSHDDPHDVTDGPYGDIEWTDDSHVICTTNHGGCGWAGTIGDLV